VSVAIGAPLTPYRRRRANLKSHGAQTVAVTEQTAGMTSSASLIGNGYDGSAASGLAALSERGRGRRGEAEPAEREAAVTRQPPPRQTVPPDTARAAGDVVRLPGQEAPGGQGPSRALVSGGAFTLAVALSLASDQSSRPASLEPVTPASDVGAAQQQSAEPAEDEVGGLTEEEQEVVEELRARDAEVRRHEAAHAAAGGQYAGSPTFSYQTGPDGRRYAVGGSVSIDTAPVKGDPEATIRKAQQIKAAATAPAEPSSQDRRVAAQAEALAQQARAELAAEGREEREAGQAEASGAAAGGPAVPAGVGGEDAGSGDAADGDTASAGREIASDDADDPDEDQDDRPASGFAAAAFSAAAASYRGLGRSPSLVSIAV